MLHNKRKSPRNLSHINLGKSSFLGRDDAQIKITVCHHTPFVMSMKEDLHVEIFMTLSPT